MIRIDAFDDSSGKVPVGGVLTVYGANKHPRPRRLHGRSLRGTLDGGGWSRMVQVIRGLGVPDGPRSDGRLAPSGGVEGRKSPGTPLDNPRPAPRLDRVPVRVGGACDCGAGAERERSESGARLRVGKNRFNSVRYTQRTISAHPADLPIRVLCVPWPSLNGPREPKK